MVETLNELVLILSFVLTVVLSIYKLVQIYRSRSDSAKQKRLLNTTQVYPEKIRRWMLDESYNEKHGIGHASNHGCEIM